MLNAKLEFWDQSLGVAKGCMSTVWDYSSIALTMTQAITIWENHSNMWCHTEINTVHSSTNMFLREVEIIFAVFEA